MLKFNRKKGTINTTADQDGKNNSEDIMAVLSPFEKRIIGVVMGGALTAIVVAVLMNLHVTHTHPDTSKQLVVVMQKELVEFKERVADEKQTLHGKILSLEAKVESLTTTVLDLKLDIQGLKRQVDSRFDVLTKTLIDVIKAQ